MSILIKGMEMPSCEIGCRAYMDFRIWNDGTVEARIGPKETEYKAIPIPPDGRLIIERDVPDLWWIKIPPTIIEAEVDDNGQNKKID